MRSYLKKIWANFQTHGWRNFAIGIFGLGFYFSLYPEIRQDNPLKKIETLSHIVKSTAFNDLLFFLIFLISVGLIVGKILNYKAENVSLKNSFFLPILLLAFYIPHRLILVEGQEWLYTTFLYLPQIAYSDIIIILLLSILFKLEKKFRPIEEKNFFLEDNIYKELKQDIFQREEYAVHISGLINSQRTENTFAIGITGKWGSGKTVFLNQIKSHLKNCEIIEFNPWLSKKHNVLADFFNTLIKKTKQYDNSLSNQLEEYSESLIVIDDSFKLNISKILNLNKHSKSLENQKNDIRKTIKDANLRFAVFVDDLDRVNANEVLSVLTLIRNSFNFPNTFFFVGYDHEYVLDLLIRKKIPSPARYLEKIFQFEIDLPSFPAPLLKNFVLKFISNPNSEDFNINCKASVDYIDSKIGFSKIFTNLRECVKFSNSYNLNINSKGIQTDMVDNMLLEILKVKDKVIYNELRELLSNQVTALYIRYPSSFELSQNFIEFDDKAFKQKHPTHEIIYEIIELLFNRLENYNELKTIRRPSNFIRYFSDHLFGNISFNDFDLYKTENGFESFRAFIFEQLKKGNSASLFELLLRIKRLSSVNELKNFIKGLLFYSNIDNEMGLIGNCYTLLNENLSNSPDLLNSQDDFDSFIKDIFETKEFPLSQSILAGELLGIANNGNTPLSQYFNRSLITRILLKYLSDFIESSKSYDSRVFIIYRNIIEKSDVSHIKFNPEANNELKTYLLKFPFDFLSDNLIIEHGFIWSLPNYIDQIFTWEEFEDLLIKVPENLDILILKNFYSDFKKGDYLPIPYKKLITYLHSNDEILFSHSPEYLHVAPGKATYVENETKINYASKYDYFNNSYWISSTSPVTLEEALKGGTYIFTRSLDISSKKYFIKNAKLFTQVDDYLLINLNGIELLPEIEGDLRNEPTMFDISKYLNPDSKKLNSFIFKVRNTSFLSEQLNNRPEDNPYDFIFTIVIELEPILDQKNNNSILSLADRFIER